MFRFFVICLLTLSCFHQSHPLIVPQELPSLLSLIYSTIPQLKKGTDSRLGFGFRLGEHADFQVLVELGPQKDTQPIGDSDSSSSSKRQVDQADYNAIDNQKGNFTLAEKTTSPSWLQNWSNEMKKRLVKEKKQNSKRKAATLSPVHDIKLAPRLPEGTLKQLQMLHYLATTTTGIPRPIVVADLNDGSDEASTSVETNTSALEFQVPSFKPIPTHNNAPKVRKTKGEITEELMNVSLD